MRSKRIKLGLACAVVGACALMLAAWAGAAGNASSAGSGAAAATKLGCGMGNGKKATGTPIKLGGIDMLIPGVDFTTVGKVAAAYFACVNDNGGINGHPIKYTLYNEQLNPAQEAALARKLVEKDKVVGVVGNTSFAECGTNAKYYASKGFVVIGAGVQAECYSTPSFAETNMGPRYSNIGAAQALIRAGVKKIAIASPDTISAYADGGVVQLGAQKGVDVKVFPTHLPVTDATSQLIQMYQFAGDGNGILIDFTPDTAPAFMKAAIAQGIVDKVKWGSSTPIANTFMAAQFPAVRRPPLDQPGVQQRRPEGRTGLRADVRDPEEVRPEDRPAGVLADGLHGREVRHERAAEHQGRDHRGLVQRSGQGPQEPEDRHALQTVVRRQPRVPHPEQLGHHRRLQGRQRRREGGVLRDRRRSTSRSPRHVSGRRSTSCRAKRQGMRIRVSRGSDE